MSDLGDDAGFIAEALPAFISEAEEQVEQVEQLLLRLEDTPGDRELLDALFRCAHTVKGSAGIFGLDRVVAFTHHVETLLDRLREGAVVLTPGLSTLLLRANDQIRGLVRAAAAQGDDGDDAAPERAALVAELVAAGSGSAAPATVAVAGDGPTAVPGGLRRWHVSAMFGTDTFRNGMDPLAILNYVRGLGAIVNLACDVDAVPGLEALADESCHLGFQFSLETAAGREEIEAAFCFVVDDCTLHVIGPEAVPEDFAALIEALPDNPRLGDILVAVGAVTRAQLDDGLRSQASAAGAGGRVRLGEVLHERAGLGTDVVAAALQKQQQQREGAARDGDNRFIRVHADRLDAVINLLGELVIAGAGASLLARQTRHGALVEANEQITRLVEEIRNGTLQLRMVPIGETFSRFRRVVRDTAAELGKNVVLEVEGGDTELDKSVVERIADPLMHLVRNALDHGLETPADRAARGKPVQGTLTLSACHEGGSILIRIADDGRGIQRDKVLKRAWERGLVEHGVTPPDAEILRLVFEAGFSTAEQVTNLSGRGVGMDVVRRNIDALRGSVAISSEPGKGSCIEIRLPLTLAIIDGFLVSVGPSKFIFPLEAVVEVIESTRAELALDARGRGAVELRGQLLPVVSLRELYALDSPAPERSSVVVVRSGDARYGVMVDVLFGQHQTVIKPLGRMFRSLRGMSGSSILGTGEVALIFDVNSLGQLATHPSRAATAGLRTEGLAA
jgi:two-component system chemotaxis sensor kinase CheA